MSPARIGSCRAPRWATLIAAILVGGCGLRNPLSPSQCHLTSKPPVTKQSVAWHLFDVSVLSQVSRDFNVVRMARWATGHPKPAINLINGAVSNSSFFTNREIPTLSTQDVRRGPTKPGGDAQPPYTITKVKGEGKSAGFFVKDAKGDRFLFKLDVPGNPELTTGAEAVTSKLLHALGYYVPSYEVVDVRADELTIAPGSHVEPEDLQRALADRGGTGALRVSASRLLEGEILGPFSFKHYRNFAELRALKLAYAWTNNTDAKDHNTLMVWNGREAIGYLIDFGTSLGADATHGTQSPCRGWLNDFDLQNWTLELITLGLHETGCDPHEAPWSPGVGTFSPKIDPVHWKPYAPNLAFDELTPADARWMAGRIAQFSRPQIEAAVAAGRYSRPEDAQRIVEVLEARRQVIVAAYLKDRRLPTVQPVAPPPPEEVRPVDRALSIDALPRAVR